MTVCGRLISVNVGQPREVRWRDRTIRTAIWKAPVAGRVRVGRLNVDGDAQADLVGHGGEHRAVFVYQRESYRHWGRALDEPGLFGENFTVDGLADDEVCIGDRLAIGSARFEVTQPRVTCFKVGVRLDEPRMPGLLTGHGRPGFYLRVLREGEVEAGDEIRTVSRDPRGLTVRRTSDLLYSTDHDPADLRRALAIDALPAGWVASFRALLDHEGGGNAGLTAPAAAPAWMGYRPFVVDDAVAETRKVRALHLVAADGGPVPAHVAGQFVSVRVTDGDGAALARSYSLSAAADGRRLRISVKRDGRASGRLHALDVGDLVDVAAPRGTFVLDAGDRPVALISAGIGVTPALAMLDELARTESRRLVTWIHVARSGAEHAHRLEAEELVRRLPRASTHVRYTGADGRLTTADLAALPLDPGGEAFLCGPGPFMAAMRDRLEALGFPPDAIHTEAFGAASNGRPPHPPPDEPGTGPAITFARSGLTIRWPPATGTLLQLAEACDVPVDWSCRSGVCHRCETGLVDGTIAYDPEPFDPPPPSQILLCCARPSGDITLDL